MTIRNVAIVCFPGKNEIRTTVTHDLETTRVNEREGDNCMVTISGRTFPTYSPTPENTARYMLDVTRRTLPGVPVHLYFA
jgi:hypothetical protein